MSQKAVTDAISSVDVGGFTNSHTWKVLSHRWGDSSYTNNTGSICMIVLHFRFQGTGTGSNFGITINDVHVGTSGSVNRDTSRVSSVTVIAQNGDVIKVTGTAPNLYVSSSIFSI